MQKNKKSGMVLAYIDLVFSNLNVYGIEKQIEYDFIVKPDGKDTVFLLVIHRILMWLQIRHRITLRLPTARFLPFPGQ